MHKDELLLRLGGLMGMLIEGDNTPEVIKALKTLILEVEEKMEEIPRIVELEKALGKLLNAYINQLAFDDAQNKIDEYPEVIAARNAIKGGN